MKKLISIIVPIYNEEKNISLLMNAIDATFCLLSNYYYEVIFVNDGSTDNTNTVLKELAAQNNKLKYLTFSRNFGHQLALKAGLDVARGAAVISLDGDMQHPPQLIPNMVEHWEQGYDIVYTKRQDSLSSSFFKNLSSKYFYAFLNSLSDTKIESGTADFRLLDEKVVHIAKQLNESDLFWRGIFKWVGFKQISIDYKADERANGKSKYTFKKMVRFALKGITSFSIKPLVLAIYIGFFVSLLSILVLPYVFYSFYFGHAKSGWASLMVTVSFFGGLQLMILGIIGLYLGKLFMQSKARPLYIISETNYNDI